MICEMHKPEYPYNSNDKSMSSTANTEHKKGDGQFKRLKISSLLESERFLSYISVSDGRHITLNHI